MHAKLRLLALLAILALLPLAAALAGASPPDPLQATDIARPAGPGRIYLPFVVGPPPSTFGLIEQARNAGTISDETALLYRVYAIFGDPRLPAEFQGVDKDVQNEAQAAMREASARFLTLSSETRRQLYEFFQPPLYVGSWWDRQHPVPGEAAAAAPEDEPAPPAARNVDWDVLPSANIPVKVWWPTGWPEDAPIARSIVALMEAKVWPDETKLMGGRTPQPDLGPHLFQDPDDGKWQVWGDGGDERLDIYILRGIKGGALTVAYPPNCTDTDSFILIDGTWAGDQETLEKYLAHEFMHTIQYSYKYAKACAEYTGMEEAGANWAIDYVFPKNQSEHGFDGRINWPERSLWPDEIDGYGDWPFFYYLTKQYNNELFRTIWDKTESMGPNEAVDASVEGGFKQQWPQFALALWNREPNPFFLERDKLKEAPDGRPVGKFSSGTDWTNYVGLQGERAAKYEMKFELPYLSMRYYRFAFPDPHVRSVGFYNPMAGLQAVYPGAAVWALIKIQGRSDWEQPEDWTDFKQMGFCRDLPDENIEELVLIFSNSQWRDKTKLLMPWSPPTLVASYIGCSDWQGTVTAVHHYDSGNRHDLETVSANVVFERRPPTNEFIEYASFRVKQGTVHWEFTGTMGDCRIESPTVDLTLKPNNGSLSIRALRTELATIGQYQGTGTTPHDPVLTFICPEGSWTQPWMAKGWLGTGPMGANDARVSADGRTIKGQYQLGTPGQGDWSVWNWHFQAVPAAVSSAP